MAAHKSRKHHCLTVARLHDLVHKIMGVHEDDRLAALVPHRRRVRRVSHERLRSRPRGTEGGAAADDDMRRGASEGHQRAPRPDDGRGLAIFVCKASDIHAASATRPAKCAATAASWRGAQKRWVFLLIPCFVRFSGIVAQSNTVVWLSTTACVSSTVSSTACVSSVLSAASSAGVEALEEGLQLLSRKRCSSSTIPVRKTLQFWQARTQTGGSVHRPYSLR